MRNSKLNGKTKPENKDIGEKKFIIKRFEDHKNNSTKSQIITELLAYPVIKCAVEQITSDKKHFKDVIIPTVSTANIDDKPVLTSALVSNLQTYSDQINYGKKTIRMFRLGAHLPDFWLMFTLQFLLGNDDLNPGNLGVDGEKSVYIDFGRFFYYSFESSNDFMVAIRNNYSNHYGQVINTAFNEGKVKESLQIIKDHIDVNNITGVLLNSNHLINKDMTTQLEHIQFEFGKYELEGNQYNKKIELKNFSNMKDLIEFIAKRLEKNFTLLNEVKHEKQSQDSENLLSSNYSLNNDCTSPNTPCISNNNSVLYTSPLTSKLSPTTSLNNGSPYSSGSSHSNSLNKSFSRDLFGNGSPCSSVRSHSDTLTNKSPTVLIEPKDETKSANTKKRLWQDQVEDTTKRFKANNNEISSGYQYKSKSSNAQERLNNRISSVRALSFN